PPLPGIHYGFRSNSVRSGSRYIYFATSASRSSSVTSLAGSGARFGGLRGDCGSPSRWSFWMLSVVTIDLLPTPEARTSSLSVMSSNTRDGEQLRSKDACSIVALGACAARMAASSRRLASISLRMASRASRMALSSLISSSSLFRARSRANPRERNRPHPRRISPRAAGPLAVDGVPEHAPRIVQRGHARPCDPAPLGNAVDGHALGKDVLLADVLEPLHADFQHVEIDPARPLRAVARGDGLHLPRPLDHGQPSLNRLV